MTIRILVIEDNLMASRLEKLMMTKIGCDVDCAPTGEGGICLANQYT